METPSRPETTELIRQISEKPFSFDFYRTVRLLEARNAGKPPLGESLSPRDDPVRFRQKPSLIFAPSTLHDCRTGDDGKLELFVNFTGLFGPNGPMPLFVTEFAQ